MWYGGFWIFLSANYNQQQKSCLYTNSWWNMQSVIFKAVYLTETDIIKIRIH